MRRRSARTETDLTYLYSNKISSQKSRTQRKINWGFVFTRASISLQPFDETWTTMAIEHSLLPAIASIRIPPQRNALRPAAKKPTPKNLCKFAMVAEALKSVSALQMGILTQKSNGILLPPSVSNRRGRRRAVVHKSTELQHQSRSGSNSKCQLEQGEATTCRDQPKGNWCHWVISPCSCRVSRKLQSTMDCFLPMYAKTTSDSRRFSSQLPIGVRTFLCFTQCTTPTVDRVKAIYSIRINTVTVHSCNA